ncbi:sulfotransferase domain-containing protein [Curvivirga sp.]|uniref:sulfotransferase domain-containing protein n=1 Tax=Curvivirga sp. TaxID=2856848 RepID=UPI003B5A4052
MSKKLAVFSHHRSGTHFLMKSLSLNSQYIDDPELSLDVNLGFDLWNPNDFTDLILQLRDKPILNIAKCHYEVDFIAPLIDKFLDDFHLIYIVRRPEDVLKSYFDFSSQLFWKEAPKTTNVNEFVKAVPIGSCLRWQHRQYDTMTHRWVGHVQGWLEITSVRSNIILITYDDLKDRYQETMTYLVDRLGWKKPQDFVLPPSSGILPGQGGSHIDSYETETLKWVKSLTSSVYDEAVKLSRF